MKTTSFLTQPLFLYAALLIITALAYRPGLSGDFLFDDFPNIVTNPAVHAETINFKNLMRAAQSYESAHIGRPLATITFAIDYSLGGKNPSVYKLVNLFVHLFNVLLIFTLVRRLLALTRVGTPWSSAAAFTIVLLWAIHPLQVSTVLYIVQRMEMLALTFVILALLAYLHGRLRQRDGLRGWPWLIASGVLIGIGLLSKETAILFPVYVLALELTVLGFEAHSQRTSNTLLWIYGVGVILALALFTFLIFPKYSDPAAYSFRDFTLHERLLSQLRILCMYIGWILLPHPNSLTFYYDNYLISRHWLEPVTTLASGLFLLGLMSMAWLMRKQMPLFSLGLFWFFAAHLLTSTVIPLELIYEHRNYFALLGLLLALADLLRHIPLHGHSALKSVIISIIVVGFAFLTVIRAATWGDPLLLATDLVAKNPLSARASTDLATMYVGMSDSHPNSIFFSMGEQELERASRLPNASPLPEQALILMAATTGQPVKEEWWDRLIDKLKNRPIGTQESLAVSGLLKQRYEGIELSNARLAQVYATILSRGSQPVLYYIQYANFVLRYLDDPQLASRLFAEAIEQNPRDVAYALKITRALLEDGHPEQALAVLDKAQALRMPDPNQDFDTLRKQINNPHNP